MLKASRGTSSCAFTDVETKAWKRVGSDAKNLSTGSPKDTNSRQDRTQTMTRCMQGALRVAQRHPGRECGRHPGQRGIQKPSETALRHHTPTLCASRGLASSVSRRNHCLVSWLVCGFGLTFR